MSAPSYVPTEVLSPASYDSPPRRGDSWFAARPGELADGQPADERLGTPGPDQGYAYRLVGQFAGRVFLAAGEHHDDVVAGVVAVATKRSGLYGRAPVVHDLTVAFGVWGFLDEAPAPELVALRRTLFEGCRSSHHYAHRRAVADAVPAATLRRPHGEVLAAHAADWRSLLDLTAGHGH